MKPIQPDLQTFIFQFQNLPTCEVSMLLSKTNIRKQVGSGIMSSASALGKAFGPTIGKTLGLSALAGLASEGASQIVKAITGKGVGGFLVPNNKIDQLIAYKHLLTPTQKKDIIYSLQNGAGVRIRPTKKQSGGAIGALLASIGIPLLLNALTGSGAPRMGRMRRSPPGTTSKKDGGSAPRMGQAPTYRPPPFIGTWDDKTYGTGTKKKATKKRKGKGILLGKDSPFNSIPILGAIL